MGGEKGIKTVLGPLRIGMLAPPWVAVPPTNYGGTELILDTLSRGLQDLGHEVTLFTVGESTCPVRRSSLFERSDPGRMGATIIELRHAAAGYDAFDHCNIVHDHTLAGLFLSRLRPTAPVVTTCHGPFDDDLGDIYRRAGLPTIAISHDQARRAPAGVSIAGVVHHGLDNLRYEFDPTGGDYLVALGRMNATKGIDIAIDVARRSGRELIIAAKMREPGEKEYFDAVVKPQLGQGVEYVGEVDHPTKVSLLAGALALINPIQWPEPFGLVMTESLACGSPVVATRRGAAPEIIEHGETGFLCSTVEELVEAVERVGLLDRALCRRSIEARFSMEQMARAHVDIYRSILGRPSFDNTIDLRSDPTDEDLLDLAG